MANTETAGQRIFKKTVVIHAPASVVWATLTVPQLMKQWMSEAVTDIITNWQPDSPFIIRGQLYKKPFENTGKVLAFEKEQLLQYTHLSSLSRLPDVPESYCILSFSLDDVEGATTLTLTISNFPTDTIYSHLAFYWNVTLELLKEIHV